jgi:hypothetical protein
LRSVMTLDARRSTAGVVYSHHYEVTGVTALRGA